MYEQLIALEEFRNKIIDEIGNLYDYNDYAKINLLLVRETIDKIYDEQVKRILKEGADNA